MWLNTLKWIKKGVNALTIRILALLNVSPDTLNKVKAALLERETTADAAQRQLTMPKWYSFAQAGLLIVLVIAIFWFIIKLKNKKI